MVAKFGDKNEDVNKRVKMIQGMIKEQKFLAAVQREDENDVDPETMVIEDGYDGPRLEKEEEVSEKWVKEALDYMQRQKRIHKKVVWVALKRVNELLEKEPTLKEVSIAE